MWKTWNSQILLVGRPKSRTSLENSLVMSYKVKNILPIRTSNPIHKYLPKRNKNIGTHKTCIWMFIAATFISSQKVTTQWLSAAEWVKCTYSYNGILLSNKKEWPTDIWKNKDESRSHYVSWEKSNGKYINEWFTYMTF